METTRFRLVLLFAFLLAGLATLVGAGSAIADTPTPTPVVQVTPTSGSTILDVMPLKLGASWVYSVTVDYEENRQETHWTGIVTKTITDVSRQGNFLVASSDVTGERSRFGGSWFDSHYYVVNDNRVFQLTQQDNIAPFLKPGVPGSFVQMVSWPLQVGQQWGAPEDLARGDGFYVWRVEDQEDVTGPTGTLSACYRLLYLTNPDDTRVCFCPGLGIARREYHHHGSKLDQVWELVASNLVSTSLAVQQSSSAAVEAARRRLTKGGLL